jgi:pyridoxine 5-phosphate synthase
VRVSLFIEASRRQIETAAAVGAQVVELHTGAYCDAVKEGEGARAERILAQLTEGAKLAASLGLEVHAGHGIDYDSVTPVSRIPEVVELNIGHFLIGEALFEGLPAAIARMRALMDEARGTAAESGA